MNADKVRVAMSPQTLRRKIRKLPARPRLTTELEQALRGDQPRAVWYRSQKEHWLGWLREYGGPGFYGRKNWHRSAEFVYNHICCPPMVLWLGDASGVPKATVASAKEAALRTSPNLSAQCAAIRLKIPWSVIEPRL
jgi:hypothetical protein